MRFSETVIGRSGMAKRLRVLILLGRVPMLPERARIPLETAHTLLARAQTLLKTVSIPHDLEGMDLKMAIVR
jgi:hypothetical protein